ncbi:MAG TPA: M14 family murein peptide amidase A [Tepidisphaeraceae bacterium]|nr:M14 family murein peptide amidase A [Tepidisphaeraceae bacterium]
MRVIAIGLLTGIGCIGLMVGCVDTTDFRRSASEPAASSPAVATPPRPQNRREVIGTSVEGRSIEVEVFGNGSPTILILGGIHGDEPTSVDCTRGLIAHLRANPALVSGRTVAIIEVANPDGYARRTRTNARGIDCNRNFPARNFQPGGSRAARGGTQPASEPETRAILAAMAKFRPKHMISIHSIRGDRQQNNYDGPGEALARAMTAHNGYPVTANIGYPTPGSLGSYAGGDLAIPIITLELPKAQPGPAAWEHNRAALLAAISW